MNDRISRRNKKQEIELKEFDKPVIDIDQSTKRKQKEQSRLKDIDEENFLDNHQTNEQTKTLDPLQHDLTPPTLNGLPISPILEQQQQRKPTKQPLDPNQKKLLKQKLKKRSLIAVLGLSILSTIMFSAAFLCLGYSSSSQILRYLSYQSTASDVATQTVLTLPFYSEKLVFSSVTFLISFIGIMIQNFISYKRYGVLHQNEFYTKPHDTLKTMHLFYCLLGGVLLHFALFSIFYAWNITQQMNLSSGVNACLMTLISLFIIAVNYLFFGKKIRLWQLAGSFISLIGLVIIAMTICKNQTGSVEYLTSQYNFDGLKVIGFNLIAVLLFGVVILLWMDIKHDGKIKYSTGIIMIIFFDGLISVIASLVLLLLGKLYQTESIIGPSSINQYSLLTVKLALIAITGFLFAISVVSISIAMNLRPFSRFYSLIVIVPIPLLLVETFLDSKTFNYSLMISMGIILIGSFMIVMGEPKHKHQHEYIYQPTANMKEFGAKKKEEIQKQIKDPLLKVEETKQVSNSANKNKENDLPDFLKD